MKCPFTGEACVGIRDIGDGAIVCPSMQVMVWNGHIFNLRSAYADFALFELNAEYKAIAARCIAAGECKCAFIKEYKMLRLLMSANDSETGSSRKLYIMYALNSISIHFAHCVRVLQRAVRRSIKLRNERKFAVAMEAYNCQYSPLNILPIDLFIAKIANQ